MIAAPRSPKICPRLHLDYAWPDLAGKASEPSRDASYPLSYLSWQGLAKSAAGSEQMASWFTEWVCHADVMQALAGCSALPRKACGKRGPNLIWFDPPLSNGPGEPSGATRDPRGRGHSGRRTAPTAWTVPTSASRVARDKGFAHRLTNLSWTAPTEICGQGKGVKGYSTVQTIRTRF